MNFAYCASLADFLAAEPTSIVGQLHAALTRDGFSRHWNLQTSAWIEEIALLRGVAGVLTQSMEGAWRWTLLLEYEIARRGRRIDAVLLIDRAVVVLERRIPVQMRNPDGLIMRERSQLRLASSGFTSFSPGKRVKSRSFVHKAAPCSMARAAR